MPTFEDRLKVLLVKIEAGGYGVDPVPTAGANAVLAKNVSFKAAEGRDVSRDLDRPFMGAQQQFPTGQHSTLTFETELVGHAAPGTAPGWGAIARAAGLAQVLSAGVSVTYTPISTAFESATFYFYFEGKFFRMRGARGTGVFKLNADQLPVIAWSFMGLYDAPTDLAIVAPTLTSFNEPQVVNKANTPTFTINGVALKMRSFELDMGVQTAFRELVNYEEVRIGDRAERIRTQVDGEALATLDPYTLSKNQTAFQTQIVHGVGAGKIVTLTMPTCRMQRPDAPTAPDGIVEWPLSITPLPNTGNDQFSLVLT